MLRKKPAFRWIHNVMKQLNTEIACIKLGRVNVITVSSPELSIEFLKKHNSVIASHRRHFGPPRQQWIPFTFPLSLR
ncbi:hypothetical protein SASPL_141568 [Salvia splendens]|uniref:Uncharacterized protein n=1 Tax=Salvia splendens TaxID=180675 RepID=A0A8X8WQS8_SALSN|nr:hypothetical protein SASPL_141568 [Salvia splendens]